MRKHHFTLVELLIVIAIIVILAGMLVTAVTRAMGKAEQAKCRATISALFNAIKQYESTYGVMPWQKSWDTTIFKAYKNTDITSEDTTVTSTSKPGKNDDCVIKVNDYTTFIKMLQGKGSSENLKKFNPRKIKFLEVQGSTEGEYKDPWGKDFTIVFNNTNHEDFFRKGIAPGVWSSSDSAIYASVIIWSKGLDVEEKLGDSDDAIHDSSNADNIYSFPVEYNKGEQRFEVTY